MTLLREADDKPTWAKNLSDRQRVFVEEYLVDLNQTAAYKRGRLDDGSSTETAIRMAASRMVARPEVATAIETLLQERGVTRLWVIDQYARMAHVDVTEVVDAKGMLKVDSFDDLEPDVRKMIAGVEATFDAKGFQTGTKVTFHNDRKAALDKLSKVLRMEVTRTEISGPNGGTIEVSDPAGRLAERLKEIRERNAAAKAAADVEGT